MLSHRGDTDLPDLTVRVEHLAALAAGQALCKPQLLNPFARRTEFPAIGSVPG